MKLWIDRQFCVDFHFNACMFPEEQISGGTDILGIQLEKKRSRVNMTLPFAPWFPWCIVTPYFVWDAARLYQLSRSLLNLYELFLCATDLYLCKRYFCIYFVKGERAHTHTIHKSLLLTEVDFASAHAYLHVRFENARLLERKIYHRD